jgi:ferredoxin
MPKIKFTKEKKEIEVPEGTDIRSAAIACGVSVYNGAGGFGKAFNESLLGNCHGFGLCGTCLVKVTKGMENTDKPGFRETAHFKIPAPPLAMFARLGQENSIRLACLTKVRGDIEVETAPDINLFGDNFFS